jgi:glycyl-tRNA synthetase beta chain
MPFFYTRTAGAPRHVCLACAGGLSQQAWDALERVDQAALREGIVAISAPTPAAGRAAELCKADLLTGMVAEFPELQGVMGRYYALHDGESKEVADAIEAHYRPRVAGDRIPEGSIACAVALADKLDALAGLFSIRELPTGDKDPFGLRRAALGIVRIIVETSYPCRYRICRMRRSEPFKSKSPGELVEFVYERFASYLKDLGFSTLQVDAVLSKNRTQPSLVPKQLEAVKAFQALPEAESLAAANKRVANILRQAEAKGEKVADARHGELKEPAERALHDAIRSASEKAKALLDRGDYAGYLTTFSVLKAPVDAFFDSVMVMVDDLTPPRLAASRFARSDEPAWYRFAAVNLSSRPRRRHQYRQRGFISPRRMAPIPELDAIARLTQTAGAWCSDQSVRI